MGYRGKVEEQEAAREMRARGRTLDEIATELGVSKSSVSIWVREVPFTPSKRRYGPRVRPNVLMMRKQEEIDRLLAEGKARIGQLSEKEFLVAGAALYAGEGAKHDGLVKFTNSDPRMIHFFVTWLRAFFDIDEARLHTQVYLHDDLDLAAATDVWVAITGVPVHRMYKPQRPAPKSGFRLNRHEFGCLAVVYTSAKTHREVMGLVEGLLTCDLLPG